MERSHWFNVNTHYFEQASCVFLQQFCRCWGGSKYHRFDVEQACYGWLSDVPRGFGHWEEVVLMTTTMAGKAAEGTLWHGDQELFYSCHLGLRAKGSENYCSLRNGDDERGSSSLERRDLMGR